MSARTTLKSVAERLPPSVGALGARIPFALRLGPTYVKAKRDILYFAELDVAEQRTYIYQRFVRAVTTAYETTSFYRQHYDAQGFHPADLRNFEDIASVPIVTKEHLQDYSLNDRSADHRGRLLLNTGGTSGQPLQFYVDARAFAREWAHMHHAWVSVGYRPELLRLTFRGRNLGSKALRYNAVHHEYQVNAYIDRGLLYSAIRQLLSRRPVFFIHGYPSAVAQFVAEAELAAPRLIRELNNRLRGILLGSEFPAPPYRKIIEDRLTAPTLSWYGHSEMALYAYEARLSYTYEPMHTYGYCEAVEAAGGQHRLIGTSYWNLASPFIRYDTGDLVEPTHEDALLRSFRISHGRIGEFVHDASGQPISLTALIFGRHHDAFARARFIQVRQDAPGRVTLIVTAPAQQQSSAEDWLARFDLTDVEIEFDVELVPEPIRASSGKVPLLIRQ